MAVTCAGVKSLLCALVCTCTSCRSTPSGKSMVSVANSRVRSFFSPPMKPESPQPNSASKRKTPMLLPRECIGAFTVGTAPSLFAATQRPNVRCNLTDLIIRQSRAAHSRHRCRMRLRCSYTGLYHRLNLGKRTAHVDPFGIRQIRRERRTLSIRAVACIAIAGRREDLLPCSYIFRRCTRGRGACCLRCRRCSLLCRSTRRLTAGGCRVFLFGVTATASGECKRQDKRANLESAHVFPFLSWSKAGRK